MSAVEQKSPRMTAREARLEAILEGIRAAVVTVDARTQAILEINRAAQDLFGIDERPWLGKPRRELFGPSLRPLYAGSAIPHDAGRTHGEPGPGSGEYLLTRADSRLIPVSRTVLAASGGRRPLLVEVLFDISARKELEHQLALSQKLESIGQLASGIAHEINTPIQYVSGNLGFLKEAFESLAKVLARHEELIETSRRAFCPTPVCPDPLPQGPLRPDPLCPAPVCPAPVCPAPVCPAPSSPDTASPDTVRPDTVRPAGKPDIARVQGPGTSAAPPASIPDRQDALSLPPLLAASLDTLDAIRRDVRYQELMREIPASIADCIAGVERVAAIVGAMKRFSHPDSGGKRLLDVNKAMESILTITRNEWKYDAEMRLELAPDLPLLPCLPGDFNQAVLNVVVNAAHAVSEKRQSGGGKGLITVGAAWRDGWLEVRIADSGVGIPKANLDRIFDPFFTTKEVGKGTGQGLAIVHAVVERHGGSILIDSEPGRGTAFTLRFPLPHEAAP